MSESMTFANLLRLTPTASSALNRFLWLVDSQGALSVMKTENFFTTRGFATDLNQAKLFGMWSVGSDTKNVPPGITPNTSDVVLYLSTRSNYGIQVYIPLHLLQGIFFRSVISDTWSNFRKMTLSDPL